MFFIRARPYDFQLSSIVTKLLDPTNWTEKSRRPVRDVPYFTPNDSSDNPQPCCDPDFDK